MVTPGAGRSAVPSLRGVGGAVPTLTTACAPHFGLFKIQFLKHYVTARQHTLMEKGIITLNIILL